MMHKAPISSHFVCFFVVAAVVAAASVPAIAGTELTLHSFEPQAHGEYPNSGLIADSAGNLYGVARVGGAYGQGIVFEFVPNQQGGWSQQILYDFQGGNDGSGPQAPLIFDAAGNLYGTTIGGGPAGGCLSGGCGTVFELKHNTDGSWSEQILHGFDFQHGLDPEAGVAFDEAGNLYGTTSSGGAHGGGIVFQLSPTGNGQWKETDLYNFTAGGGFSPPPNTPVGELVVDQAGNIFGATGAGGNGCSGGCGTIYELSPVSGGGWALKILHSFKAGSDGAYPDGGLISDQSGNLYGTTIEGGTGTGTGCNYGCGTVYTLAEGGTGQWTESVLYSFRGNSDGSIPEYSLLFDGAGNLYGVTYGGGGLGNCLSPNYGGCGTVFQLTPSGNGQWTESVLWAFSGITDGAQPSGGLVMNASGQLFGETFVGENLGQNGTLFALTPGSGRWSLSSVSNFVNGDGAAPLTGLAADSAGNLYGTTEGGGSLGLGAVYELQPAGGSWNEKMIYSFTVGHASPGHYSNTQPSQLIADTAGNLYGEVQGAGQFSAGLVYELSRGAGGVWSSKTLYTFKGGATGSNPNGGLVMDRNGNLYGTTYFGGLSENGLVFELSPGANGSWSERTIYEFGGYPIDGANPLAGLILDQAGNLYGTTRQGGSGGCLSGGHYPTVVGCGIVFELVKKTGGWQENILHVFLGSQQDGQFPYADLVFDQSGNLFGTTSQGGAGFGGFNPSGTVFELSPATGGSWTETLLFQFPDASGQGAPLGNVIIDSAGNLYSTTSGASGTGYPAGSVFELSPNSSGGWNYTTLYSFETLGAGSPYAGVIFGPNGSLYGTTWNGGTVLLGSVFEITP